MPNARLSRSARRPIRVSFEFFPPKTPEMEETLWRSVERLAPLGPSFMSVTYGAGGSTRERTHATVARMVTETDVPPAAHLTCVSATKAEVDTVVDSYREAGVRHIVALRGDPAGGVGTAFEAHPDGYQSTADLVAGIRRRAPEIELSVSAYPEMHPESPNRDADFDTLKAKVDAGANRAITQFFFDNGHYLRYVDEARKRGIHVPIVPGIVAVSNFKQTANFAQKAGASVPAWFAERFEGLENDPQTRQLIAAAMAAEQVLDLVDHGVKDFHFYTMNKADLVYAVCHLLGLRPTAQAEKSAAA